MTQATADVVEPGQPGHAEADERARRELAEALAAEAERNSR